MTPLIHFTIDDERLFAPWMPGNNNLGAAFVESGDDRIAVERLVGNESLERQRWSRLIGQFLGLNKLYPVVVMPPF
ncbi:hypothetical protein LOC54_00685 [Acetobacter sp. AN02]|uniref:hypothetical protein n=1 Tax=Acetobacter sp. AN02 TaxID=2894186 RepID=UPI0024343CDC|nr:hypothetical protein [Acetobacter sp. AN02]MDG6093641.1 hypothetical protein [Acetobacter sp. AN02]